MTAREDAFFFDCEEASLLGITHLPSRPATLGVLIVVGGPQYRVGSHRQFVLLARALAQSGYATMRFDYRGMGDATGLPRDFEKIDHDLRCAIDAFHRRLPGLKGVVLWGLCDAATAAACYSAADPRVYSLVLANPWVRSDTSHAAALLHSYYRKRVFTREFWGKVVRGGLDWRGSLKGFGRALIKARSPRAAPMPPLAARMLRGLEKRACPTLFILSGHDLVAAEFRAVAGQSREWRQFLASPRVRVECRDDADHTFSNATWRSEVADLTRAWMLDLTRTMEH